jgi:dynamin 1-like protein
MNIHISRRVCRLVVGMPRTLVLHAATRATAQSRHTLAKAPVGASLIGVMNRLQEVFALTESTTQLDLPQLVVVGSQSVGKSSVLESLVGRDFLPRGANLVTRCPIVVQLQRLEDAPTSMLEAGAGSGSGPDAHGDGFASFVHAPGKRFSLDDVKAEIARQTQVQAGSESGITSKPIVVQLFMPQVVPLSFIDTPGMTRVPIGAQPADIEHRIRTIVTEFIRRDNALILAVHAANQDLATSDALNLAMSVDRDGTRTIGVLTKIDLMDKGTSPIDILSNRAFPLKLGWFGVVARSEADNVARKSILEQISAEQEFFASTKFSPVRSSVGTKNLALRCNELLAEHIRRRLPDVKRQIDALEKEARDSMARFGDGVPGAGSDVQAQSWYLMHVLTAFSKSFSGSIDGEGENIFQDNVGGGARLRSIFNDRFASSVDALAPVDGMNDALLRAALRNASGANAALFVPQRAFEALARKAIESMRPAVLQCVNEAAAALRHIAHTVSAREGSLARHAALRRRLDEVTSELIDRNARRAVDAVSLLLASELAFINTVHPNFVGGAAALSAATSRDKRSTQSPQRESAAPNASTATTSAAAPAGWFGGLFGGSSASSSSASASTSASATTTARPTEAERLRQASVAEREQQQIDLMRSLLGSYFEIVRANVRDLTPKLVMHALVNESKLAMQDTLVKELFKESEFNVLLAEGVEAVQAREKARSQLAAVEQANKVLRLAIFQ